MGTLLLMLSRDLLRREKEYVAELLATRGADPGLMPRWATLDQERRDGLATVEALKRDRNEASRAIGQLKKSGADATEQIAAVGDLKGKIETLETRLESIDEDLSSLELQIPNLPHVSVPVGADEEANREERRVGQVPTFDFPVQAHWDLGPALGILDFESAARVAGARFTTYLGAGAALERALFNFMLDLHTREHGYLEALPPFIVNREALTGTGQLPKFEEDLFHLEGTRHYMVPTAEVPLTNLYREQILEEEQLPLKLTAFTPCFRAEAGSHGRDVRGLIRQHQFNKVELVHLVTPEKSMDALEELTGHAERVLQLLELPYRVVTLSTGDMGFSAAKTYDLEVWLPGQENYREISSCSNCMDFQARRAMLRYRPAEGGKARYVHTLNGSALAIGRTFVAVLENYQQSNGSVRIPEVLVPYMGGLQSIDPPK